MATLLVGRPINVFLVAVAFVAGHVLLRQVGLGSGRHPRSLLVVAAAWALSGVWEWLVLVRTPEADIRVDLLLIWPVVLIVSLCFMVRAFR